MKNTFSFAGQGVKRPAWLFLLVWIVGTAWIAGICNLVSAVELGSDYRLGSGDKILIKVYDEDDLTIETLLSDSGLVNYPFLGELEVKGLTIGQLEGLIVKGLKGGYLVNPNVHVSIVEYRPFFIHGEVKKPGGYPFQPGLTVSKAVALAEGFTERASKTKIYVIRGNGSSQAAQKADLNTLLHPGDIVTIEQSFF